MKKFGFGALTVSAVAAGYLALMGLAAPAMAAPSGAAGVQDTINSLEAEGYDVIVNRLSATPLNQASVVSVGRGQTFTHSVSGANNGDAVVYGPVSPTTVYVNVR